MGMIKLDSGSFEATTFFFKNKKHVPAGKNDKIK